MVIFKYKMVMSIKNVLERKKEENCYKGHFPRKLVNSRGLFRFKFIKKSLFRERIHSSKYLVKYPDHLFSLFTTRGWYVRSTSFKEILNMAHYKDFALVSQLVLCVPVLWSKTIRISIFFFNILSCLNFLPKGFKHR